MRNLFGGQIRPGDSPDYDLEEGYKRARNHWSSILERWEASPASSPAEVQ